MDIRFHYRIFKVVIIVYLTQNFKLYCTNQLVTRNLIDIHNIMANNLYNGKLQPNPFPSPLFTIVIKPGQKKQMPSDMSLCLVRGFPAEP